MKQLKPWLMTLVSVAISFAVLKFVKPYVPMQVAKFLP